MQVMRSGARLDMKWGEEQTMISRRGKSHQDRDRLQARAKTGS